MSDKNINEKAVDVEGNITNNNPSHINSETI